jgi:hypothetical protein
MLLAAEAQKRGIGKDPAIALQINDLLAGALFADIQKNSPVDAAAIRVYYDSHRADFESVSAKDILVRVAGAPLARINDNPELSDAQALARANEIRQKLAAGADFAAIARAESDDPESASNGGQLGEIRRGTKLPPFEQTAFSLKTGELSQPVKTPYGYSIILVTGHKQKTPDEATSEIERAIRADLASRTIEALRSKTTIKIDPDFFGSSR